jgi:hypothetical protein
MAATYTLISSNVLASSAASVTFSAIPSTYTDLVLRFSSRSDIGSAGLTLYLSPNASTSSDSTTILWGDGTSPYSSRFSATGVGLYMGWVNGTRTTNTFSSAEIYIPNYAGATNKVFSSAIAEESNSTADTRISATAGLWSNTAAISSLVVKISAGVNFVSGSSFYLYGIKSS